MIWKQPATIIILSLIPSALISAILVVKSSREDLNISLYLRMVLLGALAVIPGGILVSITTSLTGTGWISTHVIHPFFAVAFIEESLKLMIIAVFLYRNKKLTSIKSSINYAIAVAVGFAFAENIFYLLDSQKQFGLFLSRSFTAVPLHAICGAVMGYYIGQGKADEKRSFRRALIYVVLIHGLYNILSNLIFPYYLLSTLLVILSLIILKQHYSKKSDLTHF